MENNTNQLNAMMCKRNCGFFGNAACDGYCSKCYKDHVKRQNSGSAAGRVTPTTGLASSTATQITTNEVAKSIIEDFQQQNQESMTTATTNRINNVNNTSEMNDVRMLSDMSSSSQIISPSSTSNSSNQQSTFASAAIASSSASVPIPIPARSNSKPSDTIDPIGMSVPADLMSSSLLSTSTSPGGAASSIGDSSLAGTSTGSEKKKRTRCVVESCRRKVGLTGFDCRCGGLFCWEHRYSDKHNCQFDYKELGQDQIRKNNPIVVGEKIQKI